MQPGSKIGRYEVREKIGEGGMGEVYLAEDTKLERQVALKVLLAEVAKDEERLKRFVQEAKAASALNHPNILTVFEVGVYEGSHYIATELIKGKTLRDRMRAGDLGLTEALGIGLQAAAALGAAHEAGIIHRDIKPENIMIRDDGLVKVLDFGLAKLTEKRVETAEPEDATRAQLNTEPGLVMGTVAYMSPEQARGHQLDARSDIFSLGIVLYELFTGRRPFDGESNVDLISSILKDEPPSLKQLAPELPRQLERIVEKTLRKDREHRYQNVKDLEIDLSDLRDELKFEAKLNKTVDQGMPAHNTSAAEQRPTLTESISATRRFTLLHAILFVGAAVAVFGAIFYFGLKLRAPVAVRSDLKAMELATWTNAPGEMFSSARFSPDDKLIAFSSTKSGNNNIWVTQATSNEAIQVTKDTFSNKDPIWSPKGDEIAFVSDRGNVTDGRTNATGVWRISALGGTPKSVGPVEDGSMELRRWTSSGKIYFQSQGDLFALDVNTGQSQKVTSFDQQKGKISWVNISDDEISIAYIRQKENSWQLFTSDRADSSPELVTEGTGNNIETVWLPRKDLFYYSYSASLDDVYQVYSCTGSGKPTRITASESDNVVVDTSADGKSIIISSAKEESSLWRVGLTEGQESPISRSINSDLWPSMSPDGERVAYQSSKNLNRGSNLYTSSIQVRSLKVRDDRPTVITESGFLPTWSPDGSAIAFLKKSTDAFDLVTANPNGGGERKLSGGIPVVGYTISPYNHAQTAAFSWEPNSASIAFVSKRNGVANVWAVGVSDGAERPLTNNTDPLVTYHCPLWSSDGKKIAFSQEIQNPEEGQKTSRVLLVLDVVTGDLASILSGQRVFRLIGWSEDNSSLIISEPSRDFSGRPPETLLIRVSISQGKETEITRLKNAYYYNIFLSDDRKLIAYAANADGRDDLWFIPATGGTPRKLTNNNDSGLFCSRLAWLRDGRTIVFGKQIRFSLLSIISDLG